MKNLQRQWLERFSKLKSRMCSLTAVGGLSAVGHAHQSCSVHFPPTQLLVLELAAIDAVTACAIAICDVPTLNHELIYDSVKRAQRIAEVVV